MPKIFTLIIKVNKPPLQERRLSNPFTGRFYFPRLVLAMTEPFMALGLGKENAIADWRALIGPTRVYRAQWQQKDCLRAKYGISGM